MIGAISRLKEPLNEGLEVIETAKRRLHICGKLQEKSLCVSRKDCRRNLQVTYIRTKISLLPYVSFVCNMMAHALDTAQQMAKLLHYQNKPNPCVAILHVIAIAAMFTHCIFMETQEWVSKMEAIWKCVTEQDVKDVTNTIWGWTWRGWLKWSSLTCNTNSSSCGSSSRHGLSSAARTSVLQDTCGSGSSKEPNLEKGGTCSNVHVHECHIISPSQKWHLAIYLSNQLLNMKWTVSVSCLALRYVTTIPAVAWWLAF